MYSTAILTATVLIAILWSYYLYLKRNFNYWKIRNIPFMTPISLFGNIRDVLIFRRSIPDLLFEIHNFAKTECVGFFAFYQPYLLVREPQLIKNILIRDFEHFADGSRADNEHDKVSSNLIFIVKNPKWRSIRTKVSPIFTSGKVKSMLPLIVQASESLTRYMKQVSIQPKFTEAREMCMKYTTEVISSCALGINAHSFVDEDAPLRVAARRLFDFNISRSMSMSAHFIAPVLVKYFKLNFVESVASKFLHETFWKHMKSREVSQAERGDLIDLLINLRKSTQDKYLDDNVISAQPVQFFLAGFETTGTTLTFALYSLAKHTNIQNDLRRAVKEVLKRYGSITYDALREMELLQRFISEVLRMYPVLPYLDRRCTKPYQIPGTDAIIDKGIPVYISLLGLHYDPEYFPDPYKFDPDRFSEENREKIKPFTYMPFGDGPHLCIGQRFAIMSLKVAVIQIVSEFVVETCSSTPDPLTFDPKGFLLIPKDGKLNLRFREYVDAEI